MSENLKKLTEGRFSESQISYWVERLGNETAARIYLDLFNNVSIKEEEREDNSGSPMYQKFAKRVVKYFDKEIKKEIDEFNQRGKK